MDKRLKAVGYKVEAFGLDLLTTLSHVSYNGFVVQKRAQQNPPANFKIGKQAFNDVLVYVEFWKVSSRLRLHRARGFAYVRNFLWCVALVQATTCRYELDTCVPSYAIRHDLYVLGPMPKLYEL
jgi:hypothetical protein